MEKEVEKVEIEAISMGGGGTTVYIKPLAWLVPLSHNFVMSIQPFM